jgi:hypothetical protein
VGELISPLSDNGAIDTATVGLRERQKISKCDADGCRRKRKLKINALSP